ncbi:MarR family winged helix-turn-helix transcriptional regulator [Pseudalkalibacillus caeni]|uniref:MarR family winged helix-turn-helix transcriptional regulator n=1 Tax=Exobacillus caeni TaxID=2574798 RepID=UPI00148501E1|nr:MarR family transcriptional regulator [Pseudalkalibacillus caeni]
MNKLDERRQKLTAELEKSFRIVFRTFKKEIAELFGEQITNNEFIFLKYICEEGPKKVSELASEFHVTLSHVTAVIDRLVNRELVERHRSKTDRRVVRLHITEQGKHLVEKLEKEKREHLQRKFESLTSEEMETMATLMKKLI